MRLVHHVEFYVPFAIVYLVGILRLQRFSVPMTYAVFQFAFLVIVGSMDWSCLFLVIMPLVVVLGYRDVLETRAFRLVFPLFIVLSTYYAWKTLPTNLCDSEVYTNLLTYLRLR